MATRYNINDFALGNPAYVGATVSFWTVSGGAKTTTLATLYAASTGSTTLTNPRALDSDGKFSVPVYAEVATIATVSGLTIADHDTGIIGLAEVAAIESAAAAVAAVAAIASGALPITAISCSGGAINGTTVGATTPAAGKFTTLQTSALLSATLGLNVTGAAFTSRGITDNATATALTLSGSGANSVTIANGASNPTIGTSGGGLAFSASTGAYQFNVASSSLLVKASSGYAGLGIDGFTGGQAYQFFFINGTETNRISSDSSNALSIYTGVSAAEQVRITHTASANRYLTLTGSNGGNPTIGTSAGSLGISSPISQVTSSGASIVLFQSTAASVENTVHISATQVTSGASLKISNSGNNVQASLRLTGAGHLDIYTNQTADAVPTSGNIGFRVVNAVGSRHVTVTPDNTNPTIGVTGGALAINAVAQVGGNLVCGNSYTLPAGGSTNVYLGFSSNVSNFGVYAGSGAPTVNAPKGSLYLRSDGSTTNDRMYVNTDGSTTWTAVTTAA